MKKDSFSIWLKEFCSLVFIQTIQAFLLAIIMSVIVSTAEVAGTDPGDSVSAVGIIAIIALTSISKIEGLVKKIFGVDSSIMDPSMRGGLKSLAGTMVAAKLGSKVLNNVGKIGSGINDATLGSKKARDAANKNFARRLNAIQKNEDGDSDQSSGNTGDQTQGNNVSQLQSNNQNGFTGNTNGLSGNPSGTLNPQNAQFNNMGNTNSNNKRQTKGPYDKEKLLKIQEQYEDELGKASAKRSEGLKKLISGLAETGGAIGGASVGATYGLATGGDDILKGLMAGAGIGDQVGAGVVNVASAINNKQKEVRRVRKDNLAVADSFNRLNQDIDDSIYKNKSRNQKMKDFKKTVKDIHEKTGVKIDAGNF